MKVVLRVRPVNKIDYQLSRGKTGGPEICISIKSDGQTIELIKDPYSSRHFRYSHIFTSTASQSTVYQYACSDIIDGFLNGYHSSIICYGQTGTGKTYTMFGTMDKWNTPQDTESGMLQQSLNTIFQYISDCHQDNKFARLYMSFYEIYMENITDLLLSTSPSNKKKSTASLNIRESAENGIYVEGLSIFPVNNPEEVYQLIQLAVSNRITHALAMNETSSRSHAVLQLTLEQESPTTSENINYDAKNRNSNDRKQIMKNILTFCDLAGSERVHRIGTKNQNLRLREAQNINRSICALGNCIQALAAQSTSGRGDSAAGLPYHVPYRDSKLTRLLSETLSGNARMCIISTIGPCSHSYEETLSTLIFSSRAASVKKTVKQVKAVPGIFSGLSEKIQNWKWPPPTSSVATQEESAPEEADLPPLPPPKDPPHDEAANFVDDNSTQKTRPKSAISDLSTDTSYLYPLSLEDLEIETREQRMLSRPSSANSFDSKRRHSFSVDSRRKIQLHPAIISKRLSEEGTVLSRSKSPLGREILNAISQINPSLEMLAADTYDDHYRSSPEQTTPKSTQQWLSHSSDFETPGLKLSKQPSPGSSQHFDDDFAESFEKELERFRVSHDLHEVSPPDAHHIGMTARSIDSDNYLEPDLPLNRLSAEDFLHGTELVSTPSRSQRSHSHSPHIVATPVKITVSTDLVKLSHVPPPPSTPPPQYPSLQHVEVFPLPELPVKIDRATTTDLAYEDKATNTPLPTPFNLDPCPNCTISKNEIIILKNEITRQLDDIQYLRSMIEPDPDSYEAVISLSHGSR